MRTALKLLERLRSALGMLLDDFWPLLAHPGCPKISSRLACACPNAIPSASGCVPERALDALNGPRSISRRFSSDVTRIFVDFRISFRRFSLELHATKTPKQNLKNESHHPQRTCWLLRCAVASYCSHIFRNDFRTLHVQPFFVAYPKAHLVIIIVILIVTYKAYNYLREFACLRP